MCVIVYFKASSNRFSSFSIALFPYLLLPSQNIGKLYPSRFASDPKIRKTYTLLPRAKLAVRGLWPI